MSPNEPTPPAEGEAQPATGAPETEGVPELSHLAEALTGIPIEAVDEKFLLTANDAELEEFLNYLYICGLTLKSKGEIAHKILEFRGKCKDKARRLRALPADEAAAVLAVCTPEEAEEVRKQMDILAKGPVEAEKPPTQNLGGSFITRDVDQEVMPGGSEKGAAPAPAPEAPAT